MTIVNGSGPHPLPFTIIGKGRGFVAVGWGETTPGGVVGAYYSPNGSLSGLEEMLEDIEAVVRPRMSGPVIVAGDLNAKSGAWGSLVTNEFGRTVADWTDAMGLIVLNEGCKPTCVRPNGSSVIDITLGNPRVARMVAK